MTSIRRHSDTLSDSELSLLVAEQIMGWTRGICDGEVYNKPYTYSTYICKKCGATRPWNDNISSWNDLSTHDEIPPCYAHSCDLAWEVVKTDYFFTANTSITFVPKSYYHCNIWFHHEGTVFIAFADTPARALCLAALKAVGVIDEEDRVVIENEKASE